MNKLQDFRTDDGRIDARLFNTGTEGPGSDYKVTARECHRLRAAFVRGVHATTHVAATGFESTAARAHALGECDHDVSVPPLEFWRNDFEGVGEWVIADA